MREDTIICRCEEVTYGEIKAAVEFGLIDPGDVRKYTRAGMGSCQGRTCQRELMRIIKQISGTDVQLQNHLNPRIPAQAVSVEILSNDREEST